MHFVSIVCLISVLISVYFFRNAETSMCSGCLENSDLENSDTLTICEAAGHGLALGTQVCFDNKKMRRIPVISATYLSQR